MNEDFLTCFGGAVKSLGRNRVGGRVVTFSGAADPDRVKEYFDERTDFWLNGAGDRKPILYRHGMDRAIKRRRFGSVELTKAIDGIWAEGTIDGSDSHSRRLIELVEQGELKWSTGSTGHLFEKTDMHGAAHIDLWPIVECSLCPEDTVAEPRNLATLKSLAVTDFDMSHQRDLERRAAEIHAQTLMTAHELRMMGYMPSLHEDSRSEEQDYYGALARVAMRDHEAMMREIRNRKG